MEEKTIYFYICSKCKREIEVKNKYFAKKRNEIPNVQCKACIASRPCSQLTKDKIGKSNSQKKRTDEQKSHLRDVNSGKICSEETRNKLKESALVRPKMSDETKKKISKAKKEFYQTEEGKLQRDEISRRQQNNTANLGKHQTEETKDKIRQKHIGKIVSDETRQRISQNNKSSTPEVRQKLHDKLVGFNKGIPKSDETKQKMSVAQKKRSENPEVIKNCRLAAIKRISDSIQNGGQMAPNYNPTGCKFFDLLMELTGTFIQHAMNGGEFFVKELGYWVDGYDKENNIVYEWDEQRHFNSDGTYKKKDLIRQTEIIALLGCEFIRFIQ